MAKDEPRTFPVDNHVPFDGRGMSKAYLSNGTPMKLFFDSGASRSYLSKRFYDSNPVLHDMPKFVTTCTGIRIGNGSMVPILFMACGHTFGMSMDYYKNDLYTGEDYDDDVFASLKS